MALSGLLFLTASLCGIIWLILYHIKRLNLYREAAKFPGPPLLPIIGNAHWFMDNNTDMLDTMISIANAYPSPFRLWIGNRLVFAVCDADHVETILLNPAANDKCELYKFLQPWLGTGVFTSSGKKWRHKRKLIATTFNQRILDTFVAIFARQSELMTQYMKKELNKGEFGVYHYVSLCTLDMICETAMGVDLQAQAGHDTRYVDSVQRLFEIVNMRIYHFWLHSDFIFNWTRYGRDQRKCIDYLHGVTNEVICKKKSAYKNTSQVENVAAKIDGKVSRKTFLDLLLDMSNDGTTFSDEELREEVDTMIIAGNDTSAAIESMVMVMFATFPDIQEKAYRELCEIFGDEISSVTPLTNEDLNRMEYMERVIKETMRIFPVAPVFARDLTDDIKIGDRTLPKGSTIMVGTLKLHRWDKYWSDPMKFDPDRFLPEEVAKRHPYCYIPFSTGPRNCLGQKYAMMGMKTLISTVLRRYILKKDKIVDLKDMKMKVDFMLKPVEPLTIRIVERTTDLNINNK